MKHILFTIFIFVSGIEMYSQTRSQLTGEIYTTENTPVADAVVILKDSLVNTTAYNIVYSDSLGRFSVLAPDACANQLLISCLGYKQTICPLSTSINHLQIILKEDNSIKLDEVIVKGIRQLTKVESDRLVYNMDANPFSDDNALEAFKYVPFVASDGHTFLSSEKVKRKFM